MTHFRPGERDIIDRDPTPAEAAIELELFVMDPRPGVWAGEEFADLRALTQEQTDLLIRGELIFAAVGVKDRPRMANACGYARLDDVRWPSIQVRSNVVPAMRQRGGIDSDPLVRVLAHRAWGVRDRQWFELRGVRKGDILRTYVGVGGVSWAERCRIGEMANPERASHDAIPGGEITVGGLRHKVGERLREPPENAFFSRRLADTRWVGGPVADEMFRYATELKRVTVTCVSAAQAAHDLARTTPLTTADAAELVRAYWHAMVGRSLDRHPDL